MPQAGPDFGRPTSGPLGSSGSQGPSDRGGGGRVKIYFFEQNANFVRDNILIYGDQERTIIIIYLISQTLDLFVLVLPNLCK